MPTKEVELLGDAIAGTENEIFSEAVNGKEVETGDEAEQDRSLETMDDDTSEVVEDEGDDEAEGEAEGDKSDAEQGRDDKGKFAAKDDAPDKGEKPEAGEQREEKPARKGDPSVPLKAERQQRQVLATELETERRERAAERDTFKTEFAKLEGRLDQMLRTQQQPQQVKADAPKTEKPDIFTDPEGYDRWVEAQINQRVSGVEQKFTEQRIEASMAEAHEKHGTKFDAAFDAVKSLDRSNPANLTVLRVIREAPNPGAAMMRWHQQQETLREVGSDPAAFKQKIAEETKAQLLKDPAFRQQLIDEMKTEARGGNGGRPRTIIRNPASLNGAAGRGDQQIDPRSYDNSEGSVFESAFDG